MNRGLPYKHKPSPKSPFRHTLKPQQDALIPTQRPHRGTDINIPPDTSRPSSSASNKPRLLWERFKPSAAVCSRRQAWRHKGLFQGHAVTQKQHQEQKPTESSHRTRPGHRTCLNESKELPPNASREWTDPVPSRAARSTGIRPQPPPRPQRTHPQTGRRCSPMAPSAPFPPCPSFCC